MNDKLGLMLVVIKDDVIYPTKTIFDLGEIARQIGAAAVDTVFKVLEPKGEA